MVDIALVAQEVLLLGTGPGDIRMEAELAILVLAHARTLTLSEAICHQLWLAGPADVLI